MGTRTILLWVRFFIDEAYEVWSVGASLLFKENFAVKFFQGWNVGFSDYVHLIPLNICHPPVSGHLHKAGGGGLAGHVTLGT